MAELTSDKQQLINAFRVLPLEEMKQKLRIMIQNLDTSNMPALNEVLNSLDSNPLVNTIFCIDVYTEIVSLGNDLSSMKKEKLNERMSMIHDKLEAMHQREEEERAAENIDALLDTI